MTIYVDNLNAWKDGKVWCHLLSDNFNDLSELHTFAESIGLKRSWMHNSSIPHYDVTEDKKRLAIQKGAVQIDKKRAVQIMQEYRASRARTSNEVIGCKHNHNVSLQGSESSGYRERVWLCHDCGEFTVSIYKDGVSAKVSFQLVRDVDVIAAGIFARLLAEEEKPKTQSEEVE